ncbi:hypothetical protein ACMYSQ_012669 [Aspergillus niger]
MSFLHLNQLILQLRLPLLLTTKITCLLQTTIPKGFSILKRIASQRRFIWTM